MKPDFSGYASKAGVKCADGLTILAHAFKDKHGQKVPIVWQHTHGDPDLVLGHAVVEDRADGTYVYGYLNDSPKGKAAKELLKHGDIETMSIYANRLVRRGMEVVHGVLHEVSLVLSGANPGASIDFVALEHSDGTIQNMDDEAIIRMGIPLEHSGLSDEGDDMSDKDDTENNEIYHSMTDEQRDFFHEMLGKALIHSNDKDDDDVDDADDDDDDQDDVDDNDSDDTDNDADDDEDEKDSVQHDALNDKDKDMTHRVFDQSDETIAHSGPTLNKEQISTIMHDAVRLGSIKDSFLKHAGDYGIDDIDLLFPDAQAIDNTPEFLSRRMAWVSEVITKTRHVPFSRIKTLYADITADEARAKGYTTGNEKTEEVFGLMRRITTPTTIYKKQKLDRDDILDATTINIVAFIKAEMRLMLEEEIARAILLGDGRPALINGSDPNPDKIKDPGGSSTEGAGIRAIANDNSVYSHTITIPAGASVETRIEEIIRSRQFYRGSGNPVMFTTLSYLTDMRLLKDKMGRRIYNGDAELANDLLVSKIIDVEPMEGHQDIVAIIVNLSDYTVGTDRGGQVSFFDDFDIDFNQEKYLLETRMSGALTRLKSAIIIKRVTGTPVTPEAPTFNTSTNTITVPSQTGVVYSIDNTPISGTEVITDDVLVEATPAEGYFFPTGVTTSWVFEFNE